MAALTFDTGVPSHPQIKLKTIDLEGESITFQWVGGVHNGDCAEPFVLSIAEHGETTVNEMVEAITTAMIAKLPEQGEQP